jgi:hypothetical protein
VIHIPNAKIAKLVARTAQAMMYAATRAAVRSGGFP